MFQITINEKGGQQRQVEFDKNEVTIGRVQGNDVVLPKGNISKRHSRIVVKDGKFIIIDMQSTNGTYVNGKKITTPQVIKSSDKIYIGDFTLQLSPQNGSDARAAPAQLEEEPGGFPADAGDGRRPTGLIDEKFDNEFEAGLEPEPAAPSRRGRAQPPPEPEPVPDDEGGLELELGEPEPPPPPPEEPTPIPARPAKGSAVSGRSSASRIRGRRMDREEAAAAVAPAPAPEPVVPPAPAETPAPVAAASVAPAAAASVAPAMVAAAVAAEPIDRKTALDRIHDAIADELGLCGYELHQVAALKDDARRVARRVANQMAGQLPRGEDPTLLARAAVDQVLDFSTIQPFVDDEAVHEVVVTHHREILVDREGRLEETGKAVENEASVIGLIKRLAVLGGRRATGLDSLVDVRLRDGSRVLAAMPPLAFRGPTLTYRKSSREAFSLDDFVANGTIDDSMMKFIDYCIRYRQGIMVSIGPGVGASATLNALASLIPADERIVTIENDVELHLGHMNVTALEPSRDLPLERLIRHASGLQPERALIGVVSGSAAFDVLTAMSGPLEGAVFAYAAQSPEQAVDKLARVDMAEKCSSLAEARKLVANAVQIVLQEERFPDGSRRITKISEVTVDGDNVSLDDIFVFEATGVDDQGLVTGAFRRTGTVPSFLESLSDQVDLSIFQP